MKTMRVITDSKTGAFHVAIGTSAFGAGDLVTIFSVLSQETFSGVITSVSQEEVTVLCGSGVYVSVYIQQLLEGRVTIAEDTESMMAMKILQSSAAKSKERLEQQQKQQQVLAGSR
jgi:hypothetical protein